MIAESLVNLIRPRSEASGDAHSWLSVFGSGAASASTSAGINVTPDGSLQVTALFACIRVRAETLGSFPVHVFERTETNGRPSRRQANEHPLDNMIYQSPNPWQTSQEFHEMASAHIDLRGNFFAETIQGPRGAVDQIIPRHPDRIKVEQNPDFTRRYIHYPLDGPQRTIPQDRMWHVMMFSLDGLTGVSPITYARHAIGLAMATEQHGASGFKNGMVPAYWIKHPKQMSLKARENFRKDWRGMHGGAENANRPPIMEEDMSLHALGVSNEDSQWLQTRQHQVAEIARIYRMPLHMIGDLTRATFSNITEQDRAFIGWTMLPTARRFEQTAGRDLISDPLRYFIKYNMASTLRGDPEKQAAFFQAMFGLGVFSTNDILEMLDRNPIGPEGDQRFIAGNNLVPLEQAAITGTPATAANVRVVDQVDRPAIEAVTRKAVDDIEEAAEKAGRVAVDTVEVIGKAQLVAIEEAAEEAAEEAKRVAVEGAVGEATLATIAEAIEDAACRIVAAEVRDVGARAGKATEGRERFNKWLGDFYAYNGTAVRYFVKVTQFLSARRNVNRTVGITWGEEAVANGWCESQRQELIECEDVRATLDNWATTKAAELTDLLSKEFVS